MTVPFAEPIYHNPNLTIREVSIPAPSEFSNFIRGRQALACPRGCSPDRLALSPACFGDSEIGEGAVRAFRAATRDLRREPASAITLSRIKSASLRYAPATSELSASS